MKYNRKFNDSHSPLWESLRETAARKNAAIRKAVKWAAEEEMSNTDLVDSVIEVWARFDRKIHDQRALDRSLDKKIQDRIIFRHYEMIISGLNNR